MVFDGYSGQMSNSCCASLVRSRLRLPEAVRRIGDRLAGDHGTLGAMQEEVLRRQSEMSAESGRARVMTKGSPI